ncbi:Bug family tripartite tricarboxylate transporter substrate binding protein [Amaricoccus solimangrovi]|uniref:Tripartite tricarboxylate transporter substrate binding protein n=1 Tax=Amaricoccus solimangrovi TaxID=2589815 RepID=A0A501WSW5_9RHOB|nr:tripartite tricarboxylate transporter substrate-binding protein [Amaricoccus solimangrovi]TPE52458.1 tripartite tricarboxylate transporter substrate binding protein [Amaricoccus solimangrovi]
MSKFTSLALAAAFAATLALPAAAEIDRPECIAPAQPGGGFDLTCRVAQQGLEGLFDRPLEVSFMPGGIGAVAFNMFNTTRTDDPNAIVAFSTGSLLNLVTGKYGAWTVDDARWLATAGTDYGAVIVRADSPYQTLGDLMAALKDDPASVTVGAGGSVGSQDWMKAALLLKAVEGDPRKMRYVAFDGGGEALAGLIGGAIQAYTGDIGEMSAHMDGSLRILGVMSDERLDPPFDEVPTLKEQGYDATWPIMRGFYMGKDVPDEDFQAWVAVFEKAHASDQFHKAQAEKGLLPLNLSGKEFDAAVREQTRQLHDLAVETGLIAN